MAIKNRKANPYKELIEKIKSAEISKADKNNYIIYLTDIYEGKRRNNFFEDDFLTRIIIELVSEEKEFKEFEKHMKNIKLVFPMGINTESYEILKELYINSISRGNIIFDDKFYACFGNKQDFFELIRIIGNNKEYSENLSDIINYTSSVSTYFRSDELKKEVLSFMEALNRTNDIESLKKERILEVKKRRGIYAVNQQDMAQYADIIKKTQPLIEKLQEQSRELQRLSKEISDKSREGKSSISDKITDGISKIDATISRVTDEIEREIDKFREEAEPKILDRIAARNEDLLKDKEKKFDEHCQNAHVSFAKDVASAANDIQTAASEAIRELDQQLHRIQKEAAASLENLKSYVNSSELETLKKEIAEDSELRKKLLAIQSGTIKLIDATKEVKEEQSQPKIEVSANSIQIPKTKTLILPEDDGIELPKFKNQGIIRAFDNRIDINKRLDELYAKMEENEKRGVIYHKSAKKILIIVIKGGWVYVFGPSGSGKSFVLEQISGLLGLPYIESDQIDENYNIFGYIDPQGVYRATPLFYAIKYGFVNNFDEADKDNSRNQINLNQIYRRMKKTVRNPEKKQRIKFADGVYADIHPNFRMVATGNTPGTGGDESHPDRDPRDESVLQRMTSIEMTYDNSIDEHFLPRHTKFEKFLNLSLQFRQIQIDYARERHLRSVPGILTTADTEDIAEDLKDDVKTIDDIFYEKFIQIKNYQNLKYCAKRLSTLNNLPDLVYDEHNREIVLKLDPPRESVFDYKDEKELAKRLILQCHRAAEERKNL